MNSKDLYRAIHAVDDDILERSEITTYEHKKKSGWQKWGAVAACFGLILIGSMTALPKILEGAGNVILPPDLDAPGPVVSDDDKQPSADLLQPFDEQNVIIHWDNVTVNESSGMAYDAARRWYDPDLYTAETWGEEEIVAYYGWNLAPDYIPEGLSADGRSAAGIWREKATGEIVEEQAGRGFWVDFWEDGSPKSDDDIVIPTGFTLTASRLGILHCGLLPVDDAETTDFEGVSVTLSHCSLPYGPFDPARKAPDGLHNMPAGYYDIYVAAFELDGVEYEVEAQRLELEEVIKIVASIIGCPSGAEFTVGNS